jgi:hypothetical protein
VKVSVRKRIERVGRQAVVVQKAGELVEPTVRRQQFLNDRLSEPQSGGQFANLLANR